MQQERRLFWWKQNKVVIIMSISHRFIIVYVSIFVVLLHGVCELGTRKLTEPEKAKCYRLIPLWISSIEINLSTVLHFIILFLLRLGRRWRTGVVHKLQIFFFLSLNTIRCFRWRFIKAQNNRNAYNNNRYSTVSA